MILKTLSTSLLAGVIYTIIMGIFFKKKGIDPSRKYISGVVFTVCLFFVLLVLEVF